MNKKLIKFLLFILAVLILVIFYLSIFGFSTEKFNNKIKTEILNINNDVNLELKNVKFLLNLSNLSLNVKTFGPEVFFNNHQLKLEYIKTNISLKSFINDEFSIKNLQISTKAIKLNDIVQLARSF
jgi:UDP-galactopyranose mutase